MEKNKVLTAVHLILVDEDQNKILLARRYNTGYEDGNYSLVAGHVDKNETAKEAMIRESLEEIGITIDIKDLTFVHVMHRKRENSKDTDRIDFFFKTINWTGRPSIMEENKCDAIAWFSILELPENIVPYIKKSLLEFQLNHMYSEFGW